MKESLKTCLERQFLWYKKKLLGSCDTLFCSLLERFQKPKWERGFFRSLELLNTEASLVEEKQRLFTALMHLVEQRNIPSFEKFLIAWEKESLASHSTLDPVLYFNQELVDLLDILLEIRFCSNFQGRNWKNTSFFKEIQKNRIERAYWITQSSLQIEKPGHLP